MTAHRSLLRPLGIVGYDGIEPILLAALATEEPLLLVSDHGAAKTLLLLRIAGALGLELRHYNASLLQFDDLLGFPVPDDRGGVRYAAPPGAIWGAEVAFFDEIGRCRPESANKLFPLIHERRLQGVRLDRLRYRWAATNPPAEAMAADRVDDPYEGVEPLDAALADRFSYIVTLPRFLDLSDADRMAVIRGAGDHMEAGAAVQVRELVHATRELIAAAPADLRNAAADYVMAVIPRLAQAGVASGGRRAATLCRNLVAVRAACIALGRTGNEAHFGAALCASVPDVVRRHVPRSVLMSAHTAAWKHVAIPGHDPRRMLEDVQDPLRRALLAVTLPRLRKGWRGEALCGAVAALPAGHAQVLAWHLLPRLLEMPLVPAYAVETLAKLVTPLAEGGHTVRGWGAAQQWVTQVRERIAQTRLPDRDAEFLFAVMVGSHSPPVAITGTAVQQAWEEHLQDCMDVWRTCAAALGSLPGPAGEDAADTLEAA
jgi:MoxR-like ATPase